VKVTPLDIRRKEFKRSMRGYSDEEVDVFLDDVADEFERLFQENIELTDRVQRLEEQIAGHAQMRDALEKTLISAQLQSDEMKANARKEGELILQEAELKAREIVSESYSETQRVQQALIQLKHLEEDFRYKFRSLLEGHLKLLNDATLSTPAAEPQGVSAEAASQPAPPLVVPPPEAAAEPQPAVAPEAVALPAMAPETVASPAVAAIEDEVPTEETEAGLISLAPLVAATDEGESTLASGALMADEAIYAAAGTGAEEATAETMVAPVFEESTGEMSTTENAVAGTVAGASIAEPAALEPMESAEPVESADLLASAEPVGSSEPPESDEPTRGFFFGQQPDDIDDTFVPAEETQQKPRDFEW
jgi:cell division initiation protein